ncbi:MAG: hydrolase, partial [Firmicutes bacterium]|nr:hydrolase [Bacillota bacterium]
GKLSLSESEKLMCSYMSSRGTAEDFYYESSIDKNVYNSIRLTLKGRKGIIQEYVRSNGDDISRWGMLQYNGSFDEGENGSEKVQKLLDVYGQKRRSFSIKGAFGDTSVRGGSTIYVNFGELGDISVDEKMTVKKVSHIFESGMHTMNLELRGGMIND